MLYFKKKYLLNKKKKKEHTGYKIIECANDSKSSPLCILSLCLFTCTIIDQYYEVKSFPHPLDGIEESDSVAGS